MIRFTFKACLDKEQGTQQVSITVNTQGEPVTPDSIEFMGKDDMIVDGVWTTHDRFLTLSQLEDALKAGKSWKTLYLEIEDFDRVKLVSYEHVPTEEDTI